MIIAISILAVFAFAFYLGKKCEWYILRRKKNKLPYYQRCMCNVILLGPGFKGIATEYDRERLHSIALRAAYLGAHRPTLGACDLMLDRLVHDTQLDVVPIDGVDSYLKDMKETDLGSLFDEAGKIS